MYLLPWIYLCNVSWVSTQCSPDSCRSQALIALATFNSATSGHVYTEIWALETICTVTVIQSSACLHITQLNKITLSIEEVFRCLLYTKGYFLYHYTMKNECAGDGITYISYEEINFKCQQSVNFNNLYLPNLVLNKIPPLALAAALRSSQSSS